MAEIKKLQTEMVKIKSDIARKEELLQEYWQYKDFLFSLSPAEWREAQLAKARRAKARAPPGDPPGDTDTATAARDPGKDPLTITGGPKMGNLLWELEEQNLTLIQNSGETEESLEEMHCTMDRSKKEMDVATDQLTSQITAMSQTIATETERAAELELKARLYNFGKSESANEDHILEALGRKVQEVYRCCLGEPKANPSTLQMLGEIESHLLQLLESMEVIPRDTLDKVEKMKERERRIRLRDQKLQQQKQHQEERLRKALDRAQADIRRTNGRRLMTRSQPAVRKVKSSNVKEVSEQEELHAYFFT
ncbi:hypothetical protein CRUP_025050 [Coryphaenoides rupestris]|nr:hypothetical protein CRUP_025050 [Coryphaenoides rupestris]